MWRRYPTGVAGQTWRASPPLNGPITVATVEPRDLLRVGPDAYTATRDAEVKRRRAAGDKAGATALKALTRPSLALWGVLVAAEDDALVTRAVEATGVLAATQGAAIEGRAVEDVVAATVARRRTLDDVTAAAVAAIAVLAALPARAEGQRHEIRTLVDRLTRHPELLDAWLDGTLRDVPDDTGFEAFAAFTPVAVARPAVAPATLPAIPPAAATAAPAAASDAPAVAAPVAADDTMARRRRERAELAVAKAHATVAKAEQDLEAAGQAVVRARAALSGAETTERSRRASLDTALEALARVEEAAAAL